MAGCNTGNANVSLLHAPPGNRLWDFNQKRPQLEDRSSYSGYFLSHHFFILHFPFKICPWFSSGQGTANKCRSAINLCQLGTTLLTPAGHLCCDCRKIYHTVPSQQQISLLHRPAHHVPSTSSAHCCVICISVFKARRHTTKQSKK